MRSLMIIPLVTPFLLNSNKASAAPSEIRLTHSQSEVLQLNEINVPQSNQSLTITSPTLAEHWSFSLTLNQIKQDLSNRNIILKNSDQIPLSELDSGERQTFMTSVNYNWGSQSTTINVTQDLKKSLFTSKVYSLNHTIQLYSAATQIILGASYNQQNQPLSYYIDPESLESKERLTVANTVTLTSGLEQIWTEKFKTLTELKYQKAEQLRPAYYTLAVTQATALSDRWTFKSQLAATLENRQERLYDDRGYFESRWLDVDFNYEWSLDAFLALGFSFLEEKEFDPRRNRSTNLGTDELAIAVKQELKNFTYDVGFSYFINSEKQTATAYKGSLAWNF